MSSITIETVFSTFNAGLERFVRGRIDDEQATGDILQDVYLKIHQHLPELRSDALLTAWVYTITRNAIRDYYRGRRLWEDLDDSLAQSPEDADEGVDDITSPLALSVRAMAEQLPEGYRTALLMADYQGLPQREVAERLGLSISGAKTRIQRARRMLRALLEECCHFQFDRLGQVIDYAPRCCCCSRVPSLIMPA